MSPAADGKAQCFAVRRGEITGKQIGANLYTPAVREFLARLAGSPFTKGTLKKFVAINPPVPLAHVSPESLVSFVPMEAVEDNATGAVAPTDRPLAEVSKGYTPFTEGDVIWAKITPCMQNGKSAVARNLSNGIGFGSTEFHVFRPRTADLLPDFIWEFLAQKNLLMAAKASFTGSAGQQRVSSDFLENLPFPVPSLEQQRALIANMSSARVKRRAKLAEAEALLAGLDAFVLDALGLTPPPKDDRKVFAVRRASVPARFDPHFHLPAFAQNLKMLEKHGSVPLGSLVTFSDEIWKPEAHGSPAFRYIEISTVNTVTGEASAVETPVAEAPSRARMFVREHDIIVSLTRPHHGAIAQLTAELDGCVASTGFSVLRHPDENRVSRDYLWCVLRTKMCLDQMLQRASGGNYPAITEQELAKVLVPVPDRGLQNQIATEAHRRREEARRLRAEAEADWDAAKRWFEEQLLGKPTP